jgi:predicted secreted protein
MAACTPPEELVGYGALLQYYNNLTSAWVTVGGTKDLEYPEDETPAVETTASDTGGGYTTRIPSLLSTLNEVTYTLNYRWSQYTVLRGIKENRDVLEWRVVLMNPEQTYIKFCAFISSLSVAIPMEELIEFDLTLNPTGAPELGELV